jgi:hypothetical protein
MVLRLMICRSVRQCAGMKNLTILLASMCFMGCSPDWNGTFVGSLTLDGTCSDGSTIPTDSEAAQFTLEDKGDSVSWEAGCGATVIADIRNDTTADVRQASCPSETDANGITRSFTIEGGTLDLNENNLRMELDMSIVVSGAVNGTCDATLSGTMKRLEE